MVMSGGSMLASLAMADHEEEEARPLGPQMREAKEPGFIVISAFMDGSRIKEAVSGEGARDHVVYGLRAGGQGGEHTFYREDITFVFKDGPTQKGGEPEVLSSLNGVPIPREVFNRAWRRRRPHSKNEPLTLEEKVAALNDYRTIRLIGNPFFTEFHHQREGLLQTEAQKGGTIGLQMNGRLEGVLTSKRVVPGEMLEAVWQMPKDLIAANIRTNRTDDRASLRLQAVDPKRPQKVANDSLQHILVNKPQAKRAMNLDPAYGESDDAGYDANDDMFPAATFAKGRQMHFLLILDYMMKKGMIQVKVDPAKIGLPGVPLSNEVSSTDDEGGTGQEKHVATVAFLAQLIGAVPVDEDVDSGLKKLSSEVLLANFRETVLAAAAPERLKIEGYMFGSEGENNDLLDRTTKQLKKKDSAAARLFTYQHEGLNREVAAFTQIYNGQQEQKTGVVIRGTDGNKLCAFLGTRS